MNDFTKIRKNKVKLKENILINIKQINKNLNEFNIKQQKENIKLSKKFIIDNIWQIKFEQFTKNKRRQFFIRKYFERKRKLNILLA